MATALARWTGQMACTFFRFQQIHFISLGNAMQAQRSIGFGQCQETVAPAKTGVAMNGNLLCCFAHRKRVQHASGIGDPALFMMQMCQRRAGQGIESAATCYAAITLQALRVAMSVKMF